MSQVQVGIIGLGEVGHGIVELLQQCAGKFPQEFLIKKILVADASKPRKKFVDPRVLTTDPDDLLMDPEIEVIVEVMGGVDLAANFWQRALHAGKHIVTANKALVAEKGPQLQALAAEKQRHIFFEGAVAGGIPIIRTLYESLQANRLTEIVGILNGTCNFILSTMTEQGIEFSQALQEAQALGYAEPDPSFDISGRDVAHKLAILARAAFQVEFDFSEVHYQGIANITHLDLEYAGELGFTIKHIGYSRFGKEGLVWWVKPCLLPQTHPLAKVSGVMNAVQVIGEPIGETIFYGPGAGGGATASAVVSDLLGFKKSQGTLPTKPIMLIPEQKFSHEYYIRLQVKDHPGVIAEIATALAEQEISIEALLQKPQPDGEASIPIVIITRPCDGEQLQQAVQRLENSSQINGKPLCLPLLRPC